MANKKRTDNNKNKEIRPKTPKTPRLLNKRKEKQVEHIKKSPFLDRVLNTITERIQAEIIKKDALIQTDSLANNNNDDLKQKFEQYLTQKQNENDDYLIARSKSDSLIHLKQNNNCKKTLINNDFIKLPRSKTDITSKTNNNNNIIHLKQNKPKLINRPRFQLLSRSTTSYRSFRPIFSRSFKKNQFKRYDIRRHSICGLYEAEILKNIKDTALIAATTTTNTHQKVDLLFEQNPFEKDATFTNNAIFKYLKSNSDSKFLNNEELFVMNTNNTNNNNNNDLNKLEANSSKSDEFIECGKSKFGIHLERSIRKIKNF